MRSVRKPSEILLDMAPGIVNDDHDNMKVISSDHIEFTESSSGDEDFDKANVEAVAIIGFSLKFPQDATSPDLFWKMMMEKRCAMTEFPANRLNIDSFYHPDNNKRNTIPLRGEHFVREDLGFFNADFFSITPLEATAMDPVQRSLLETAYTAFENAGIPLDKLSGFNTSVHTGCFTDDYKLQLVKDPEQLSTYAATGVAMSMLANRLS